MKTLIARAGANIAIVVASFIVYPVYSPWLFGGMSILYFDAMRYGILLIWLVQFELYVRNPLMYLSNPTGVIDMHGLFSIPLRSPSFRWGARFAIVCFWRLLAHRYDPTFLPLITSTLFASVLIGAMNFSPKLYQQVIHEYRTGNRIHPLLHPPTDPLGYRLDHEVLEFVKQQMNNQTTQLRKESENQKQTKNIIPPKMTEAKKENLNTQQKNGTNGITKKQLGEKKMMKKEQTQETGQIGEKKLEQRPRAAASTGSSSMTMSGNQQPKTSTSKEEKQGFVNNNHPTKLIHLPLKRTKKN